MLKRLGIDPNSPEEKAWEAYRDAQLKAIYPPVSDERVEYGSIYPMCWAMLKQKLTESRIRDLKALTISEGDGCLGYRIGGERKLVVTFCKAMQFEPCDSLRVVSSPLSSVKSLIHNC